MIASCSFIITKNLAIVQVLDSIIVLFNRREFWFGMVRLFLCVKYADNMVIAETHYLSM